MKMQPARNGSVVAYVAAGVGSVAGLVGVGALLGLTNADGGDAPFYRQHNLVSDGFIDADHTDVNLVNAWGIAAPPTGPWWVSDNGTGVSTLFDGAGVAQPLVVTIPTPPGDTDPAKVTGVVFNGSADFVVSDGTHSGPARFIFATEDGIIAGWSPTVPPPPPSHQAQVAVDNSEADAIYKGLAIGFSAEHGARLYAADFHNARVDVFDASFQPVNRPGAFLDHHIPAHFAPFGIQNIDGRIFVTYAMQDEEAHDNVDGRGLGFVDVFDAEGRLLHRFASRGRLNAPWGLALAPNGFGHFSGDVLVGNFGDGRINAYDHRTGEFRGELRDPRGRPISIEGLWGLGFGNGGLAGPADTLFFTAGPDDEAHGLFGKLEFVGHGGRR